MFQRKLDSHSFTQSFIGRKKKQSCLSCSVAVFVLIMEVISMHARKEIRDALFYFILCSPGFSKSLFHLHRREEKQMKRYRDSARVFCAQHPFSFLPPFPWLSGNGDDDDNMKCVCNVFSKMCFSKREMRMKRGKMSCLCYFKWLIKVYFYSRHRKH